MKIFGRRDQSRVVDGVARVHDVLDGPLRIVAVKPPTGGHRVQAFYSNRYDASAKVLRTWYAMRWSIEEANQSSKKHMGFEELQNWCRRGVQCAAPVAMLLHRLMGLWFAGEGHRHYTVLHRPWYRGKPHASFAVMPATLRCRSIREQFLSMGLSGQGSRKVIETLKHAVQQAA